jgi:DNA polymerase-3 subunit gamma/tau
MSLYLKYRPTELSQIKGNSDIVATLEGMLSDLETCPHTFLLHGETGCGKTTIGRIIANQLGCKGSDFREIDSADFRGIDTVREIRKNSIYKSLEGDCRVWLIDECHKMTNDAQNALLKILEDTPKHIYFILCTTEPQKLISTIRGRCIELQMKPLTDIQMKGLLRGIVKQEGETLESEIYDQIIQDSLGHPRNAIQILEQVLSVSEDRRLEVAKQTAAKQSQIIELCRVLINPKSTWKETIGILNGLKDQEAESIRRVIIGYCQAILLKTDMPRAGLVLECFMEPNFTNGYPQLVLNCYQAIKNL